MEKFLFHPEICAKPADKFFENAVAWLLALAGYSVVNLNPAKNKISFDKIKAPETDVEIGSADLLAYEESKRLLLIDCDINGVDNSKVQSVVNAKKYLEITSRKAGGVISVYFQPGEFVDQQPWNEVNFVTGRVPCLLNGHYPG